MYIICKIVLLQSHHESRRAKIAADIISGSFMILNMEGQVKLIALWDAMFHAAHVHLLLRNKFWLSKNWKNAYRTQCAHTEISTVQNSSLVNLYSVFHTTALFRMC